MGRVFANGLGDLGSVPGRVIPKTLKWYLIPPFLTLCIIRYVSRVKWNYPGKGVAPSLTLRCSSYWKGSLLVSLDYGHQQQQLWDKYIFLELYGKNLSLFIFIWWSTVKNPLKKKNQKKNYYFYKIRSVKIHIVWICPMMIVLKWKFNQF